MALAAARLSSGASVLTGPMWTRLPRDAMWGKQVQTDPYEVERVAAWARGMGVIVSDPMVLKWEPGHRYYQVCLYNLDSVRDFWTRDPHDKPVPKLENCGSYWRDDRLLVVEDAR